MLPLGIRVQEKLERLLDEHMQSIGASKVSMSSITSEELWRKSGRLDKVSSELFRLRDRKDAPLMLSPTHEEEITSLVAGTLKSYKDLPIKLYQISRKYRDELRPRQGLLRSREFTMKDLYTFDTSREAAIDSYHQVAGAYKAVFDALKLRIIVAEASSGDMGGDHSHEYHLAHSTGSDTVLTCDSCDYAANDEVAVSRPRKSSPSDETSGDVTVWHGVTKDRKTLVKAWYRSGGRDGSSRQINIHAVKSVVPEVDTAIADPISVDGSGPDRVLNIVDSTVSPPQDGQFTSDEVENHAEKNLPQSTISRQSDGSLLNLLTISDGDGCPRCDGGSLQTHRALELGHTFYLGTRYSKPLGAKVTLPQSPKEAVDLEMGCYGIGVSRILATVAEHMFDDRGLNWPRAIAPFEAVVIPTSGVTEDALKLYDALTGRDSLGGRLDAVLDDRKLSFGWKMRDAELTGYPVVVVLGKQWTDEGLVEVQCRRLSLKEKVPVQDVGSYLQNLLSKL